jgi:quercetin dioxygenase-like cupin family protein
MSGDAVREPFFVAWQGRPVKEIVPGVRIQVVSGEKLMFSRVVVDPGAIVPDHQHPHEQFGLVLEGDGEFTIGAETRHVHAGDYYAIPGGERHRVVAGPHGGVFLDVFSPPREEYK